MKRPGGVNDVSYTTKHLPKYEGLGMDGSAMVTTGKKKAKREVEQKEKDKVSKGAENDKIESREMGLGEGGHNNKMGWAHWEEFMPWVGGVVDEQMSWGSVWLPFWDMDFMGEAFRGSLYSDVVWDDDIWNLKREIPYPIER